MITRKGLIQTFKLAQVQFEQAKLAETHHQVDITKKHYVIAERLFRRMVEVQPLLSQEALIWAYLSHIDYWKQQFKTSIEEACKSLSITSDLPQAKIAIESLRGSIYYLAHTGDPKSAEAFLEGIRLRYGKRCATEASPYWLAISPELMEAFEKDAFQKEKAEWEYFPGQSEEDMAYLKHLVERFPKENYLDYALFFLGRYLDIILYCPDSPLLDEAYYAWGLEAFKKQRYEEAINRFKSFLYRFKDHDWHDDALWRIAKAYFMLGDYPQALRYLTLSKNELRGSLGGVDPYCDIAYIVDVYMNEEEIKRYAQFNIDPEVNLILLFTLAEKALVLGQYDQAQAFYEEVMLSSAKLKPIMYVVRPGDTLVGLANRFHVAFQDLRQYNNITDDVIQVGQLLVIPSLGPTLVHLSLKKLEMIHRIKQILEMGPPESLLNLVEFYSFNPDVFENELWEPRCVDITEGGIPPEQLPPEYFKAHNAQYRIAELWAVLIDTYLDFIRSRVETYGPPGIEFVGIEAALYKMAENYDKAASDRALADLATIEEIRQKAVSGYRRLLARLPENSKEFDAVFEAVGAVYLHRPNYIRPLPWSLTEVDVRGLLREYARLAEEYPNHHLANNALNWVAWSYCYLANLYAFSPYVKEPDWQKYEENYKQALAVYRQLAQMNPLSGITQNAIKAIAIIEEKLADPSKRTPVPWERWSW
jgi:tetratricopeptide (TPR) repeat protein